MAGEEHVIVRVKVLGGALLLITVSAVEALAVAPPARGSSHEAPAVPGLRPPPGRDRDDRVARGRASGREHRFDDARERGAFRALGSRNSRSIRDRWPAHPSRFAGAFQIRVAT